jgi:hypothetical protein
MQLTVSAHRLYLALAVERDEAAASAEGEEDAITTLHVPASNQTHGMEKAFCACPALHAGVG